MIELMSGPLEYTVIHHDVYRVDAEWWIQLPAKFKGREYQIKDSNGKLVCALKSDCRLYVYPGCIWDGSSGPTVDGKADPIPSLVHDKLHEGGRAGKLPPALRTYADSLYYDQLRARGMSRTRAGLRYVALRIIGWTAWRRKRGEYVQKRAA